MNEVALFPYFLAGGFISGLAVFIYLFFITAPYGRHSRGGWGPTIPTRLAWILMELPAAGTIAYFILTGRNGTALVTLIFLGIWEVHYLHRTFIFPFRIKASGKRTPVFIVIMANVFNVFNGYVNGRYLGEFADAYATTWLTDPRFIGGVLLFFVGFAINFHADSVLFNLRKPGETGYKIPQGGLYKYISCPNYFGECLEWLGWAILTWSVSGLMFFAWTVANLIPRAYANHQWYKEKFDDYPKEKKAVVPGLF